MDVYTGLAGDGEMGIAVLTVGSMTRLWGFMTRLLLIMAPLCHRLGMGRRDMFQTGAIGLLQADEQHQDNEDDST